MEQIQKLFMNSCHTRTTIRDVGKLDMINGYVGTVLDRLTGIRSNIVRNDNNWQVWEFPEFVTGLEKWTQRNLISNNEIKKGIGHHGKEKLLNTKKHQKKCVYYEDTDHNSTYCKKTSRALLNEKKILMEKKLCFNCTGSKERVQLATKDIALQYVENLTQVFPRCLQQIKEM